MAFNWIKYYGGKDNGQKYRWKSVLNFYIEENLSNREPCHEKYARIAFLSKSMPLACLLSAAVLGIILRYLTLTDPRS
uniref:Uncharacterized protein n=1 Tax=Rhizophagus irregularis (strain DAOM 181602 / DAOM 197198 / MUCL 43194) TaxID=747089 RepID=U9UR52_RHIID